MTRCRDLVRGLALLALVAGLWLGLGLVSSGVPAAHAEGATSTLDRVRADRQLRVCIWPDYYGITFRNPRTQQLVGIDVELSAQLARDLDVAVTYVDASFVSLIAHVTGGRCDVAMFAIGILPARQQHLAFSQPYLQSDIHAITTRTNRQIRRWADIDQPGVKVAVQAGTFMEPVMARSLKSATLVVVRPPATREAELEAGRVDVFMTDYPYSRRLLDTADWARLISPPEPFHVVNYGYAVKPGDARWLAYVDDFVARIRADGRLAAAAQRHGLSDALIRR